jgi:hypothetical protein
MQNLLDLVQCLGRGKGTCMRLKITYSMHAHKLFCVWCGPRARRELRCSPGGARLPIVLKGETSTITACDRSKY